jgi:hypothetical protein
VAEGGDLVENVRLPGAVADRTRVSTKIDTSRSLQPVKDEKEIVEDWGVKAVGGEGRATGDTNNDLHGRLEYIRKLMRSFLHEVARETPDAAKGHRNLEYLDPIQTTSLLSGWSSKSILIVVLYEGGSQS